VELKKGAKRKEMPQRKRTVKKKKNCPENSHKRREEICEKEILCFKTKERKEERKLSV